MNSKSLPNSSLIKFLSLLAAAFFVSCNPVPEISRSSLDPGWPRVIEVDDAILIFHQPQLEAWDSYYHLETQVAFEASLNTMERPVFGSAGVSSLTETDFESRSVLMYEKRIDDVKIHSPNSEQNQEIERVVRSLLTSEEAISLDRLLAMAPFTDSLNASTGLSEFPPEIHYSDAPAILVIFDGDPLFAEIGNSNLEFAVNTNWDILYDDIDARYYLRHHRIWLAAGDLFGEWQIVNTLPESFYALPNNGNWEGIRANLAPELSTANDVPNVFINTVPAELIVTNGPAKFSAITGTDLMRVTNTESRLFYNILDANFYYLVSGRWFKTANLSGNWSYASNTLPAAFQDIPARNESGEILSSVPGTSLAAFAAIETQIPRTAEIRRETRMPETIFYSSEPEFDFIDDTDLEYAINSPFDVILSDEIYYLCFTGIWFFSHSPYGPWQVCSTIPPAIYTIPESSPLHHVTHVKIYGYSGNNIRYGYTPGYLGVFAQHGIPVFGSGFYHQPFIETLAGEPPVYFPQNQSYGFQADYQRFRGKFLRNAQHYGPYGGSGHFTRYHARSQSYRRGEAIGLGDDRAILQAQYDRSGIWQSYQVYYNRYTKWGGAVFDHDELWHSTRYYTDEEGGRYFFDLQWQPDRDAGSASSGSMTAPRRRDLYVGIDGNVYNLSPNGWQISDEGLWRTIPLSPEAATADQSNRNPDRTMMVVPDSTFTDTGFDELSAPNYQYLLQAQKNRRAGEAQADEYFRHQLNK